MYRRDDPRFRRQITQLSHNIENANEAAQERLYSLTEHCLKPCFFSIGNCLADSTSTCFPRRDERPRRSRQRPRGRPEASFDFYDDWEQDEQDALLAGEDEELEGFLSPDEESEPTRRGLMNYGTRGDQRARPRRLGMPYDHDAQTYIPKNSYFGFLERLPFRKSRGLRYTPSAADLKIRGAGPSKADDESSGHEGSEGQGTRHKGRQRSSTQGSRQSQGSYSSRGDIFPSDEEDDAIPLDDEFAMALEPHDASSTKDDTSSGRTRKSKSGPKRSASTETNTSYSGHRSPNAEDATLDSGVLDSRVPSIHDLQRQEREVQQQEDSEIVTKRDAAEKLARDRGLNTSTPPADPKSTELQETSPIDERRPP